jgi:Ala-tRNA(Pro) deacylase
MSVEELLFADIATLAIAYDLFEHEAVFTVVESEALETQLPGAHTKNLFLKDAGGQYWLVTVPAHIQVDLKCLPESIGCKRVSFGKANDLMELLSLTPGSVTPLGAISDRDRKVLIVLDAELVAADRINIHPLRNTATMGLSPEALIRLLRHWEHDPLIAEIPRK